MVVSRSNLPLRWRSRRGSEDAEEPPARLEGPLPGCGDVDPGDGGGEDYRGERDRGAPSGGAVAAVVRSGL